MAWCCGSYSLVFVYFNTKNFLSAFSVARLLANRSFLLSVALRLLLRSLVFERLSKLLRWEYVGNKARDATGKSSQNKTNWAESFETPMRSQICNAASTNFKLTCAKDDLLDWSDRLFTFSVTVSGKMRRVWWNNRCRKASSAMSETPTLYAKCRAGDAGAYWMTTPQKQHAQILQHETHSTNQFNNQVAASMKKENLTHEN